MGVDRLNLPQGYQGQLWLHHDWGTGRREGVPMHRHRELEFNLVTRGSATYIVGERRVPLRVGTLLWLFRGQDHVLIHRDHGFEMWIGVFRPGFVRALCRTALSRTLTVRDPGQVLVRDARTDHFDEAHALCLSLLQARQDADQFNAGLGYLLLRLWAIYRSAPQSAPLRNVHPAVERAAVLLRDVTQPMKIEELSWRVGLSPSRLSRLFKQETGVGLSHYRNQQRIERFFALTNRARPGSMLQRALEAGFGSYPQFHRVFKTLIGQSPARFHRRQAPAGRRG